MTTHDAARPASPVPCFEWRVHHELPNRSRFRPVSPPPRGTPPEAIERAVAALPGIHRAEYTPETGSLLVQHDGAETTRRELRRVLAALRADELPCVIAGAPTVRGGTNDAVKVAVLSLLSAALPPAPRAALQLVQSLRAAGAR
jgi:hypothetical protein